MPTQVIQYNLDELVDNSELVTNILSTAVPTGTELKHYNNLSNDINKTNNFDFSFVDTNNFDTQDVYYNNKKMSRLELFEKVSSEFYLNSDTKISTDVRLDLYKIQDCIQFVLEYLDTKYQKNSLDNAHICITFFSAFEYYKNVDDLDLDIFIKNLKYTLDTSFIDTLRNSTITIAFCMIGNGANGISPRGEVFELNKKLLYTFCEKLENLNKSSNYCINSVLNYLSNINKTMAGTSLFDYYPFSIKDITDNYNNNLIVLKNIDLNKYFYKKGISLPPKVSNSTNGTTNLDTSNDYNLIGIENPNEIYQEPYTPKEQTKIIDDAYYFIVFNSFDESNDIEKHFRLLSNNCASNINTPALGSVRNKVIYVNNTAPGSSVIEKNINASIEIMKIIKKNNLKKVSITFFDPPSCASSMLLSPDDAYKKVFDSETDFALLEMPLDNVITLTYVDMMHKDSEYDPTNIDKTKLHNVFCNTIFSAKLKKFQKIHITRLDRITIGTSYKIFPKYQDILQTMSFYDNIKIKGTNYTNNYPLPAELSTIIRDKSKPIYTYNFAYKKDNSTSYSEVKYVDNEDKLKNFSAFQLLKYFYDTRIYNTTLKPMDVYITETLQVINNLLTNDYNILYTPADKSIPGTVDVAREMNLEKLPDKTLYDYKRIKDYDTKNYEFQTNTKLINKQPENCENANFVIDYTCSK